MSALLIAVGNPLRGDDGVAERVLSLVPLFEDVERKAVFGLAPELAQEVARHDLVVIIDADVSVDEATLQPLDSASAEPPALVISHSLSPQCLFDLARELYTFGGKALLCRLPAKEFARPYQLTQTAADGAERAAQLLTTTLENYGVK